MTFQEIVNKLSVFGISKDDFAYGDMENTLPEIGEWKLAYQKGGEGEGDSYQVVNYFPDHDVYISLYGYYASYSGTDFDDYEYEEVRPQQKVITVYE